MGDVSYCRVSGTILGDSEKQLIVRRTSRGAHAGLSGEGETDQTGTVCCEVGLDAIPIHKK